MSEGTAPVVTPSVLNPPKNGATSATQPSSEPKPATAAPAGPTIEEREAAIAKREQAYKSELKKFTESKGGLGAKLSEHAQFKKENDELKKWRAEREQEDEMFALNPEPKLKKAFGDDYYDKLMQFRINGVPPAQLIAARVSEIERKFEAKLAERDAQAQTAAGEALQREEQQARHVVASDCTEFFTSKAGEYPLLETYGDAKRIGSALGTYIEQEFNRTGKLLSPQEAAEKLEAAEYSRMEKVTASEKYKPKLQEKLKAATVSPSSGAQGAPQPSNTRRTLGNHLTASTQAPPTRRTDEQREADAKRVFNEVRSRHSGS